MRHYSSLMLTGVSIFVLAAAPVCAADQSVTSRVGAVTIYPDGAQVSRVMDVDVVTGASTLVIGGLPATIDPASLRVEGAGNAALSIASVDLRPVPGDPAASADPALTTRLEGLQAEREALQGRIEAADLQKATIQRYANWGPDVMKGEKTATDPADWSKAWTALSDGMIKVNEQLFGLRVSAKKLDDQIAALNRVRLGEPRGAAPVFEARIAIEAATPLKANLALVYQVRGASWSPTYDARLTTEGVEKPKLQLTRKAVVSQNTGEDWGDVGLQLSTVRLQRRTAAPVVLTSTLNLRDPAELLQEQELAKSRAKAAPAPTAPPLNKTQAFRFSGGTSFGDVNNFTGRASYRVVDKSATLDAGAYQAAFTVPGKVIVPKDGTQKTFTLNTQMIEPELSIKAAPSLDPTAYLEAGFINAEEAPLLAGPVMIHRDGTFVGRDMLKLVAGGDKATLGFGADDSVKITRVPLKKRENDAGFFGNTRTDIADFKTTAKNLHKFSVKLTILDRLPVSENAALMVEPLSTNTAPTEKIVEDKRGVMSWSFDLKPTESREVRLGWRLKWPADRDLVSPSQNFKWGGSTQF